jgi:hypothetical protein
MAVHQVEIKIVRLGSAVRDEDGGSAAIEIGAADVSVLLVAVVEMTRREIQFDIRGKDGLGVVEMTGTREEPLRFIR